MELTKIIAIIVSILSVLANIYILKKNSKVALRAESSWREELMKVASSSEIEKNIYCVYVRLNAISMQLLIKVMSLIKRMMKRCEIKSEMRRTNYMKNIF